MLFPFSPFPPCSQQQLLVNSAVTSTEGTPRSDNDTMRNQMQLICEDLEEEVQESVETQPLQLQQQQTPVMRQVMQVRRVRSEMKYLETTTKEKKRESKSDHEFANERDVS